MDEKFNDDRINSGEISGFDSVQPQNEANPPAKEQEDAQQGYTVTPEGGFYTKQRSDIIQDNAYEEPETSQSQDPFESQPFNSGWAQPPKTDFKPNGTYGSYAAGNAYGNEPQGYQNPPTAGQYNAYTPPYAHYAKAKPPKPPKRPKTAKPANRFSVAVVVIASLLAALIGAGSGVAAVLFTDIGNNSSLSTPSGQNSSNVNINVDKTVESVVQAVAEKVSPSVVGIRTTTSVMNFFGGSSESTGEGSGVIYTADGYIITNYHVIESVVASDSASKIDVFMNNDTSKSFPATVIGYNISSDLAVIKINEKNLTPVEIADSSSLSVGQYVITMGSPGGLEFMGSVTYGVISGLNRVVSSSSNVSLIQTDAAINPGNSGGALLNTSGQLIGINSSKIVSEEFEGMGFAIPINTVVEKCKSIISRENKPEPYIGITVSEKYTAEVLEYYGYPNGAVVLSVDEGSPASKAGIQRGDIITEFNGKTITEYPLLNDLLAESTPNKTVPVKIYRSGRYYSTNITIASNNAK